MAGPPVPSTGVSQQTMRRILITECYWYYQRSCDRVRNRFRELFGTRVGLPTNRIIDLSVQKFHEGGSVAHSKGAGRPRSAINDDSIEVVRCFFEENEQYSIRQASLDLNINRESVRLILRKKIKSFPYKIQLFQQLTQWDKDRRDQFAFRMSRWIQRGKVDPKKIWWSDECHFWLSGYVNKQNYRFWATENPRIFETSELKPVRITVWCAISAVGIIGPIFLEENITGELYTKMLEEEFIPAVQGLNCIEDYWYMQDGARPHRTDQVFALLDEHFHGRVIGLDYETRFGCGIEWPPCSPDLNPCDYYLWGNLKDKVYRDRPGTADQLKARIIEEIGKIDREELARTIVNFESRLELVLEHNGGHIEQYKH